MPEALEDVGEVRELRAILMPHAVPASCKVQRDADRLKRGARWVLVVNEAGINIGFIHNKSYVANVIAVIERSERREVVRERLLFEIGISRGRPYARTESSSSGSNKVFNGRQKGGQPDVEQIKNIWPVVLGVLEESVLEARAQWKNKEGWVVYTNAGFKERERGIHFTVSQDDSLLLEAFMLSDLACRKYLRRNASVVRHFLRRFKFTRYPEKQLKSFAGVKKVVEMWKAMTKQERWLPRYTREVLRHMPQSTRLLFDQIADVHALDVGDAFVPDERLQSLACKLTFPEHLHVRFEGLGKIHGVGTAMFEIAFTKQYREANGV